MAQPTLSATNSLAKNSKLIIGSNAGARLRVASTTATTVVVDSVDELTNTSLYTATDPGQLIIAESAAGASNNGDVANITGISGTTLTVDVDFDTGGELADGDIVVVLPPMSFELFPSAGHTLNTTVNNDFTMGLTETFDTHNTPMDVTVGGDISVFQTTDSNGFARILMAGLGGYKQSSGHIYRPFEADDGTFANVDELTAYSQDGNGIIRQAFFGLFGNQLVLDFPEGGVATATLSLAGNGAVREIGGTGKEFTSGTNDWLDIDDCDTGTRFTFKDVFVELGGSYGDDLTDAVRQTVKSLSVTISRGTVDDQVLGDAYHVKAEEGMFTVSVAGSGLIVDDELFEKAFGGSTDAIPGDKAETRLLIKAVSQSDTTKSLAIDIPRGIFEAHNVTRSGQVRFMEDFTFRGLATLDGSGCIDTATPPLEVTFLNGDTSTDLGAAL